jgi:hypothetical protein
LGKRLPDVDHYREIEGGGRLLCAPERFEIVGIGHVFRQPRLDADDNITMAGDCPLRQSHVGNVHVVQLAAGRNDAGARNVHQSAAYLRGCPRNGRDLIDVVRASRAGIDPAGHTVLQQQRRAFIAAAGMGVDVDQSWSDDLAARIDRLGGVARDVGLDRDDPAAGNREVACRIEPNRGVNDAPALDQEIVGRRGGLRNTGEQRGAGRTH